MGWFILAIVSSMFLGAVSWHMGLLRMEATQKKHGCYSYCEYCGKPMPRPLTSVLKARR